MANEERSGEYRPAPGRIPAGAAPRLPPGGGRACAGTERPL